MKKYHYTFCGRMNGISNSQSLIPTGGLDGERPMLWFSANPQYEPTAIKIRADGHRFTLSEFETLYTLFRFELVGDHLLLPWKKATEVARIPDKLREGMELVGRSWGGRPADWYGTPESIPLNKLRAQMYAGGSWVSLENTFAEVAA